MTTSKKIAIILANHGFYQEKQAKFEFNNYLYLQKLQKRKS